MSQLELWSSVKDRVESTMAFLVWLQDEHGIQLNWDLAEPGTPLDARTLIDSFFGVDREQLEIERRKLLEHMK